MSGVIQSDLDAGTRWRRRAYCSSKIVDYISAAAFLIPRDLFLQARGFDLAYAPSWYEDTGLCLKAQALGRKILFCPQSKVIRVGGSAANDNPAAEAGHKALGGKFAPDGEHI